MARNASSSIPLVKKLAIKTDLRLSNLTQSAITRISERHGVSTDYVRRVLTQMYFLPRVPSRKTLLGSKTAKVRKTLYYYVFPKPGLVIFRAEPDMVKRVAEETGVSKSFVQQTREIMIREGIIPGEIFQKDRKQAEAAKEPSIEQAKPKPKAEALFKPTIDWEIEQELNRLGITDRGERMLLYKKLADERLPEPKTQRLFKSARYSISRLRNQLEVERTRNPIIARLIEKRIESLEDALAKAKRMKNAEEAVEFLQIIIGKTKEE